MRSVLHEQPWDMPCSEHRSTPPTRPLTLQLLRSPGSGRWPSFWAGAHLWAPVTTCSLPLKLRRWPLTASDPAASHSQAPGPEHLHEHVLNIQRSDSTHKCVCTHSVRPQAPLASCPSLSAASGEGREPLWLASGYTALSPHAEAQRDVRRKGCVCCSGSSGK